MNEAELTLLISEFKYRDANGVEQKAYKVLPWGRVKYNVKGDEEDWTVPVHLTFEGKHSIDYTNIRVKFEAHNGVVSADGLEGGLHELAPL